MTASRAEPVSCGLRRAWMGETHLPFVLRIIKRRDGLGRDSCRIEPAGSYPAENRQARGYVRTRGYVGSTRL